MNLYDAFLLFRQCNNGGLLGGLLSDLYVEESECVVDLQVDNTIESDGRSFCMVMVLL